MNNIIAFNLSNKVNDLDKVFVMSVKELNSNPFVLKDGNQKKVAELYICNLYNQIVIPSSVIWSANDIAILIIVSVEEVKDIQGIEINIEQRKEFNKISGKRDWDIKFYIVKTLSQNDVIHMDELVSNLQKLSAQQKDQIVSMMKTEREFFENDMKDRLDWFKKNLREVQNDFAEFIKEQFQKELKRDQQMLNLLVEVAEGENTTINTREIRVKD